MTYESLIRYADHYNDFFNLDSDIILGIKKKDGTMIGTVSVDTIDKKNRNGKYYDEIQYGILKKDLIKY